MGPSGNVWITDYEGNRVDEFTGSGGFVGAFGFGVSTGANSFQTCVSACQAGSEGSGSGQFTHPAYLAFSPGGHLYVTDLGNNRVEEFSTSMEFLAKFGSAGTGQV